eukprot:TRINITY_DN5601_c1_g1_i1.p1 TRINITY_DN5601_c1_g1~~TRINITY_DN5601_c1_g1_i1.p1  ORF type:complete len:355 (+),score=58.04 TRINITY_DN5601_c1_g1_i1:197-1261(+)
MANSASYRQELRDAVLSFASGQGSGSAPAAGGGLLPRHINLYLFGPQGSGKTSFVRSCFRALYGRRDHDAMVSMETTLQRSDDGTSMYSVYSLTDRVCLHDTRGQREYTPEEMEQLRLVLEGRARPNTLVQQRRRYLLLLREFWRTDAQMRRTFSRTVMLPKASLDTEPHFAFLVLDPNQQELLLEDEDFRECYGSLLGDFSDRGVPHALLCTHGDTLTAKIRAGLLSVPEKLCARRMNAQALAAQPQGPGGVLRPVSPGAVAGWYPAGPPPSAAASTPQRMPDVIRIVTNYVDGASVPGSDVDETGNDIQQDIHTLLVLLDALRQADDQIMQRVAGKRPAPMPEQAEMGCPLL